MSLRNKIIKMQRKEMRRRLGESLDLLKAHIKPRPRFIPRWLWYLGLSLYIKRDSEREV